MTNHFDRFMQLSLVLAVFVNLLSFNIFANNKTKKETFARRKALLNIFLRLEVGSAKGKDGKKATSKAMQKFLTPRIIQ